MTRREAYERALTIGPDHQDWPFHCFWCGAEYSGPDHYPYCSAACGVRAEQDGPLRMAKASLRLTEKRA